jgi:hypothetical protein
MNRPLCRELVHTDNRFFAFFCFLLFQKEKRITFPVSLLFCFQDVGDVSTFPTAKKMLTITLSWGEVTFFHDIFSPTDTQKFELHSPSLLKCKKYSHPLKFCDSVLNRKETIETGTSLSCWFTKQGVGVALEQGDQMTLRQSRSKLSPTHFWSN